MLEAIRAQELQMQHLSDIIPALDMVHSSLISSISIDPVRLQSHQTTDQPRVPLMSAANFEVCHRVLTGAQVADGLTDACNARRGGQSRESVKLWPRKFTPTAGAQGISLSSSLRGLPKPQRQYVPVRSLCCVS